MGEPQPDIILCRHRRQLNLMNFSNWLHIFLFFGSVDSVSFFIRGVDYLSVCGPFSGVEKSSQNTTKGENYRSRVVLLWLILLFFAVYYKTSGAYANQCPAICIYLRVVISSFLSSALFLLSFSFFFILFCFIIIIFLFIYFLYIYITTGFSLWTPRRAAVSDSMDRSSSPDPLRTVSSLWFIASPASLMGKYTQLPKSLRTTWDIHPFPNLIPQINWKIIYDLLF